ncbi:MAG: glycosyl hydrolase family 95 catalytic domain-containing protein, partial [Terrimicrobiaceae bacterium]
MKNDQRNRTHRTLTSSYNRFTADPLKRLQAYRMVWGAPGGPPSDWKAGAALGNGDIGALIYGHPADFGIALGKSDLWDRVPGTKSTFRGESFEQLRQIFAAKDQSAFNRLFSEPEVSPKSHATGGGTLRLHFFEQAGTHSPQLTCDLATATSELEFYPYGMDTDLHTWGKIKLQSLVSRSAQVVAMRLMATDICPGFAVDPTLRRNFPPEVAPVGSVTWELSRGESSFLPRAEPIVRDGVVLLKQSFKNGDSVVTALAAKNCETESHAAGSRATGVFRTVEGSAMEIFVTLVTSQDAADPLAEAEHRVRAAMETGYEKIHAEHTQWWSDFWKRSAIFLSDPTLERWFYVSLYYCASAIEPGRQSPGLQGVWVHEEVPAWFGDYHTNVNLQAVYWGVFGANRVELAEPFLRLIRQLYPQAKRDTESYFRMKGVRFPHAASIEGFELTEADWAASLGL